MDWWKSVYNKKCFSPRRKATLLLHYSLLPITFPKKSAHSDLVKSEEWKSKKSAHSRARIFWQGQEDSEPNFASRRLARSVFARRLNTAVLQAKPQTTPRLAALCACSHAIFHSSDPYETKEAQRRWRGLLLFVIPLQNRSIQGYRTKSIRDFWPKGTLIPWYWRELTVSAIFRAVNAMLANEAYVSVQGTLLLFNFVPIQE